MKKTLKEIADLLGVVVEGDSTVLIHGIAGIQQAQPGEIIILNDAKYIEQAEKTNASAIVTSVDIKTSKPLIKTQNPTVVLLQLASLFYPQKDIIKKGVHPSAVVGKDVVIDSDAAIGPYVVIDDGVYIGSRSVIYPGVHIGYETRIGEACIVYSNVSIREKILIGKRVIIHAGTVIGADGFGYDYDAVNNLHQKIPHIGTVMIEDDVEIGANVTIDRARFEKTVIGQGTKIDNLVHIAHNVIIGKHCIIVAQVGISGSTTVGDNTIIAGQAGLAGHLKIGDKVIIGAQAGVTKSVPSQTFVSGYPAQPHKQAARINAYIQRLPQLYEMVAELKSHIKSKNKVSKRQCKNKEQ